MDLEQPKEHTEAGRVAVFKIVKNGGCHSKQQLMRQLEYITNRSVYIEDSRGEFDGCVQLDCNDLGKLASRFVNRWNETFSPKLGNSTHMYMSFPFGTISDHVQEIASEICMDFFGGDFGIFDYIIAVRMDCEFPQANVVVNRRAGTGEYLFFGKDHHFNYDAFREAMVEVGARYGVRMYMESRSERGAVDTAPETEPNDAAMSSPEIEGCNGTK